MAIFTVIATRNPEAVLSRARNAFGDNYFQITDSSAFVAAPLTAVQVTEKIGLVSGVNGPSQFDGSAIVASVGSYFGRASPEVWDWLKAKWETHDD